MRIGRFFLLLGLSGLLPTAGSALAPGSMKGHNEADHRADGATERGSDSKPTLKVANPVTAPNQLIVRFKEGQRRAQAFQAVPKDLIADIRPLGPEPKSTRRRQQGTALDKGKPRGNPRNGSTRPRFAVATLKPGGHGTTAKMASEVIEAIESSPGVLYAEPDYPVRLATESSSQSSLPNDFNLPNLWGLHNTGQSDGKKDADIDAPAAWAITHGDRAVTVAVIDTGVDYLHPDLAPNIWVNEDEIAGNGVDDDGNGYIDDRHGYDLVSDDSDPIDDHNHGTHVAGTIGAVGNNERGTTGVAWEVSLQPIKAFGQSGNSQVSRIIEAVQYAVANGADIINASWGEAKQSRALKEAIVTAQERGVLTIAAAGNESSDSAFYPAAYDATVAVAASDDEDKKARFTSFGPFVDVAAPGSRIFSTFFNNDFGYLSGTSMAAPHVTGVAALVLARRPEFSNIDVANILKNSVDPIQGSDRLGNGRINAAKALAIKQPLPRTHLEIPETAAGNIDITGSAFGKHLSNFTLSYGPGENPKNWTEWHRSSQPVEDGVLFADFHTPQLEEGTHTFRLKAANQNGHASVAYQTVQVENVNITSPQNNDIVRAGERITIQGNVFGRERQYRLEYGIGHEPEDWRDTEIDLVSGGNKQVIGQQLATWDTSGLEPNRFYTLRLTATDGNGDEDKAFTRMLWLDSRLKQGWPRSIPTGNPFPKEDWRHLKAVDLDGNGTREIVIVDPGDRDQAPTRLLVLDHQNRLLWSKELHSESPFGDIPTVGDVDGNGSMEIFVDSGAEGQIFGFHADGRPLSGEWPVTPETVNWGKALSDLNQDGRLELIAYAQSSILRKSRKRRPLVVLDANGNTLAKWDNLRGCSSITKNIPETIPAIANLDEEPDLEIAAVSGCHELSVFKLSKPGEPIWSKEVKGTLLASPVTGDLDGNGTYEIVIGAYTEKETPAGGLYAFNRDGTQLPGWPVLVESSFLATPALADLDSDRDLEIIIPSWKSETLHVLHHHGFAMKGWPAEPSFQGVPKSSPTVADINNDSELDIIYPAVGSWLQVVRNGRTRNVGGIRAWDRHGKPIDLTPKRPLNGIPFEGGTGSSVKRSAAATLTDLEGDGRPDLLLASLQDTAYLTETPFAKRKLRSSLYAWELDVGYDPGNAPWPMARQNPANTGRAPFIPRENHPPVLDPIPDQTVAAGQAFVPIKLDHFVDDPEDPDDSLTWSIAGNEQLIVALTDERVLKVSPPSAGWIGQETLTITVTDPGGLTASKTVSFSARENYNPPLARLDTAQTPEETPVTLDPSANDSAPSTTTPELIQFSQGRFGTVKRTEGGLLEYTPNPDFHGEDSFSYTVRNEIGATAIGHVRIQVHPVNDPPTASKDRFITREDTMVVTPVRANDVDPEGDPLRLVDREDPEHGTLDTSKKGALIYSPNPDFHGIDTFSYTVADTSGAKSTGTAQVRVKSVNDPPRVLDQTFELNRNTKQHIEFEAKDPDDDDLTFTVVKGPEHGELFNFPEVADYLPTTGFSGNDSFTYRADDGRKESGEATVSLTITDRNNPPDAKGRRLKTKKEQRLPIELKATDADDDPLQYRIVTHPNHGKLTGKPPSLVYHPQPGFKGDDRFDFVVSDGIDSSEQTTISITVTDKNTKPHAEDQMVETKIGQPVEIHLKADDPEADPLVYTVTDAPKHGVFQKSFPSPTYKPEEGFVGSDRFRFEVTDGQLTSGEATVTIDVLPANEAPEAKTESIKVPKETAKTFRLPASDPDGDKLQSVVIDGPENGRLAGQALEYTYRPSDRFAGGDAFSYRVWDGNHYSPEATINISVLPTSHPKKVAFESIRQTGKGGIRLKLTRSPSTPMTIQASTNLIDWKNIATIEPGDSATSVIHTNAGEYHFRFFRLQFSEAPPESRDNNKQPAK